jgi:hypothetical protein
MATEKVKHRRSGSLKSNSVNAKVTKFDTAVLRFVKRSNPDQAKLVSFIQNEWLKKTKSYLPASTAAKVAKRFAHLQLTMRVKGTRKQKQRGGAGPLASSPFDAAFGPGSLAAQPLRMPADNSINPQFGASSPVSYFTIAQDRGIPADGWAGYGPKPGMGDNTVSRRRTRKHQRGGAALSLPGSVPMSTAELGINTVFGVKNPVFSSGNPVVPGFKQMYTPLNGSVDTSTAQITSALPLVWKTTA